MKCILTDIEGTTTSISFATDVLFPLSYERMEEYIKSHWDSLRPMFQPQIDADHAIATLRSWIQEDKKETILKTIQGKIWKDAFESGEIKGHVYSDVPPAFQRWKTAGLKIGIYSSGSIEAQQLIFRYSIAGDLTPHIDAYFDTTTGAKREPESYKKIVQTLNFPAQEILFLSDVSGELDAAAKAGLQTRQLIREGTTQTSNHEGVASFAEIF